ncbi:unnamed protein product [Caenorhabditis sp. 36 PRJEB53466]|nr:unnamed protein product [Caenorhabditis sp. 36 PRJEB53466]
MQRLRDLFNGAFSKLSPIRRIRRKRAFRLLDLPSVPLLKCLGMFGTIERCHFSKCSKTAKAALMSLKKEPIFFMAYFNPCFQMDLGFGVNIRAKVTLNKFDIVDGIQFVEIDDTVERHYLVKEKAMSPLKMTCSGGLDIERIAALQAVVSKKKVPIAKVDSVDEKEEMMVLNRTEDLEQSVLEVRPQSNVLNSDGSIRRRQVRFMRGCCVVQ